LYTCNSLYKDYRLSWWEWEYKKLLYLRRLSFNYSVFVNFISIVIIRT
jgi:hypothetical protein